MKNDYLDKTIASYDSDPHSYLLYTKDMIRKVEVKKFMNQLAPKAYILDAGCGYGKYAKLFTENAFQVTGIDMSVGLLKEARKYAPEGEYKKMDIRKLDFADKTFDAVWSTATIHHLTMHDIKIALTELHRVLKKGGIIFVSSKAGEGSMVVKEDFAGKRERFFTFVNRRQLETLFFDTGFTILETGLNNESNEHGKQYRDIDFITIFAKK